ncbi:MAG: hypothetical protein M3Y83_13595 [Actinomycetota bacterium]|nr:hypothetical protein [Actinomycetota bacterium]
MMLTFAIAGMALAPPTHADTVDKLKAAVDGARAAACEPLQVDPIVEQAANDINESNDVWLDHGSRAVPVPDAMPLLKDLGYPGSKSTILYGAGKNEADSIKALLLQGYRDIPDCSYSDVGLSVLQGNSAGWILSTAVLAA